MTDNKKNDWVSVLVNVVVFAIIIGLVVGAVYCFIAVHRLVQGVYDTSFIGAHMILKLYIGGAIVAIILIGLIVSWIIGIFKNEEHSDSNTNINI